MRYPTSRTCLAYVSKYCPPAHILLRRLCSCQMRCSFLSPTPRCTRYQCAVPPALAPSCIVTQCAEISDLTHLFRLHVEVLPPCRQPPAPPVCSYLMRCSSLSPAPCCTRYQCAVSPALAPPCIATQCAEISNLTHLLSLHVEVLCPPHATPNAACLFKPNAVLLSRAHTSLHALPMRSVPSTRTPVYCHSVR